MTKKEVDAFLERHGVPGFIPIILSEWDIDWQDIKYVDGVSDRECEAYALLAHVIERAKEEGKEQP